ncbi:MAG TPA: ABC transporter permease [Bryobacteraceae bacterium]|nr:ABC transporter permease [Bryobacteraceae bacterium]
MNLWTRLFRRRKLESEFDEELRTHLDMATAERTERGEAPAKAREAVRREFGNPASIRETTREIWGWPRLELMFRDVKFSLRQLRRNPAFTAVAILSLGLGIGANTAIFSIVKAMLLAPLPYPEGDQLVMVWEDVPRWDIPRNTPAPANFLDWRSQNRVFESMAAFVGGIFGDVALTGAGDPEQIHGAQVSANFFRVLRVRPALGDDFKEKDDESGARVAVIGDSLWRRHFGAARDVIGRGITLDGTGYTIAGVMPPSFAFPTNGTDVWTPLAMNTRRMRSRGDHFLQVVARLKKDVTMEGASVEMKGIARRLELDHPETNTGIGATVVPLREQLNGDLRSILFVLATAVGLVLMLVCANIANLLLARALSREREMAMRAALGASRSAVLRQLLTESSVLAIAGGIAGLAIGYLALAGLLRMVPADLVLGKQLDPTPHHLAGSVDLGVAAFAFGISILAGALFGLAPALSTRRAHLNEILKAGSRSLSAGGPAHLRSVLVVAETALAFALLVAAGLTLRSFAALASVKPGFDSSRVLTMSLNLLPSRYPTAEKRAPAIREILRRVKEVPGVESAGIINLLPMTFRGGSSGFYVEGTPPPAQGQAPAANNRVISPEYFKTLRIPLRAGRYFDDHDVAGAPLVAVINETMAQRYFPGGDAVDKRFKLGPPDANTPWYTVAGVVGDVHQYALDIEPNPEMYFQYEQSRFIAPPDLAIRTTRDPVALVKAVRLAIRAVDADSPTYSVRPMDDVVSETVVLPRLEALMLGGFGWLAVILASIGIYGVISHAVSRRTTEIGIRMALGARPAEILWKILRGALGLTSVGLAIGIPAVLLGARVLSPLLYNVKANDPPTLLSAAALLMTVAALAAALPALRASRVDPVVALRNE